MFKTHIGLYTDFYELTMAQGYFLAGRSKERASFEYFYRTNPFEGGYVVYAGLAELLDVITHFTFAEDDLNYLKAQGLKEDFLDYLRHFKFSGDVYSVREGDIVFPNEPLFTVDATLIEAQLIETVIMNYLNFQSLIATKARRIRDVAGTRTFADFGLRRAQGLGGVHASRAAVIGGADSTSNVYAGKKYDIPISGTHAHSWVQSFDTELEAFRKYAEYNLDATVLLVDTYDTLHSGLPNAIIVAKELEAKGHKMKAIRLDSGDFAYLSKEARKRLDAEHLNDVGIVVSNQLNELIIKSLIEQNAEITGFGIGTELVTGQPDGALGGVYKLVECDGTPRLKISENIEKITLPGQKKLVRYFDDKGLFFRDGVMLRNEHPDLTLYHPFQHDKNTNMKGYTYEILSQKVIDQGKNIAPKYTIQDIKAFSMQRFECLAEGHKRFLSPHLYKVGVSNKIIAIRDKMIHQLKPKHRI